MGFYTSCCGSERAFRVHELSFFSNTLIRGEGCIKPFLIPSPFFFTVLAQMNQSRYWRFMSSLTFPGSLAEGKLLDMD